MTAFAPFLAIGVLHIVLLALGADPRQDDAARLATATKGLLMPALLLAYAVGCLAAVRRDGAPRSALPLGAAALLLSWLGDVSLSVTEGPGFLLGLGFFLLAHLAWIATFARALAVRRPPRAALVYLAWWLAFVVILAPHTGVLLAPVALYGAVLGLVAALGLGAGRVLACGTALFLVSDTLLGLHTFYPGFSPWQIDAVIMTGYLAGQGLIVLGILRRLAAPGRRAPALR